jgi:hypothetical protein
MQLQAVVWLASQAFLPNIYTCSVPLPLLAPSVVTVWLQIGCVFSDVGSWSMVSKEGILSAEGLCLYSVGLIPV